METAQYSPAESTNEAPSDLIEKVFAAATASLRDKAEKTESPKDEIDFTQWGVAPNDTYFATAPTVKTIPPGIYSIHMVQGTILFKKMKVNTDSLIILEDTPSKNVVGGIRQFWTKKDKYEKFGILYRRGIILSGPPGAGKSASLAILSKELVDLGGIVVYVSNPALAAVGLQQLREIEPDRPLICIFEDIDEMIDHFGEHELLALLDGEYQIAGVTNLATTNYPDKLAARIINRPSRFDEHIKIEMPCAAARKHYIKHITRNHPLEEQQTEKWVRDTENFSIAHLRELMVAVQCLDQPYESVLERLKLMAIKPKAYKEFNLADKLGFGKKE